MKRTGSEVGAKLALSLAAGALFGSVVGACGSGGTAGSGSVAQHADPTNTEKIVTRTVTEPAQTATVTQTKTAAGPTTTKIETTPGQTSQTSTSKTLVVTPTSTTGGGSGSGVPWWGWVLIALGAVGVAVGVFSLGRHSGGATTGADAAPQATQPPPAAGPPGAQP